MTVDDGETIDDDGGMTVDDRDLARRIREQFSGRGGRSDVWRGFDAFLDTESFLNLGYTPRYRSHLVGSPQNRLAGRVLEELEAVSGARIGGGFDGRTGGRMDDRAGGAGGRLLDVGCGRGGPTRRLAGESGFDVIGIDLVEHNVGLARETSRKRVRAGRGGNDGGDDGGGDDGRSNDGRSNGHGEPAFLVGDATRLPFASGTFAACVAIDSLVYVPRLEAAFGEIARVLSADGVGVASDLVADPAVDVPDGALERFGEAWDMPRPRTREAHLSAIEAAGLDPRWAADLTEHSVGRFRKWSRLYLALAAGPTGVLLSELLRRGGMDPGAVTEGIRAAHEALPALRHVLVTFEK